MSDLNGSDLSPQRIYFGNDRFWLVNLVVAFMWVVCAMSSLLKSPLAGAVMFVLILLWIIFRITFEKRSPQWVEVDVPNKVMHMKPRWPRKENTCIHLQGLVAVETHVPMSRFPRAILELAFSDGSKKSIYFDLEKSSTSFFSIPKEVISFQLEQLVFILRNQITVA